MGYRLKGFFLCLLLVFLCGTAKSESPAAISANNYFELKRDFPNLFLDLDNRGGPSSPTKSQLDESKALLAKALKEIFLSLSIPMIVEGNSKPQLIPYFPYLNKEIRTRFGSNSRVIPSGGVVRSAVAYIYDELLSGVQSDSPRSPRETLELMAQGKFFYQGRALTGRAIPAIFVRGIGSDLDSLAYGVSQKNLPEVTEFVLRATNSMETSENLRVGKSAILRTLFSVADIKDWHTQLASSIASGGSSVDWMSFDPVDGKFLEPALDFSVVDDLIAGKYRYLISTDPKKNRDSLKQTVRGLRPLLELPWIELGKGSELLFEELQDLNQAFHESKVTENALEQFFKLVRNSRRSGAKNRFWRGSPGSLEGSIREFLLSAQAKSQRVLVPEFIDQTPLSEKIDLPHDFPRDFLISPNALENEYGVHDGQLFHGTPKIDNALAIFRGGLLLSTGKNRGIYVYGRGAYSSVSESTAQNYAGTEGLVFKLKIKNDPRIRILDWEKAENHPYFKKITSTQPAGGLDQTFEILHRRFGIDIIKNNHFLIQNSESIECPKSIGELIDAHGRQLDQEANSIATLHRLWIEHSKLYNVGLATGETHLKQEPLKPEIFWKLIAEKFESQIRSRKLSTEDIRLLATHVSAANPFFPRLIDLLHEILHFSDPELSPYVIGVLIHLKAIRPEIRSALFGWIIGSNEKLRQAATQEFTRNKDITPLNEEEFVKLSSDSRSEVQCSALRLAYNQQKDSTFFRKNLFNLLDHSDSRLVRLALHAFKGFGKLTEAESLKIMGLLDFKELNSYAISSLMDLEFDGKPLETLLRRLEDPRDSVAEDSMRLLFRTAKANINLQRRYIDLIDDKRPRVRDMALAAIANFLPQENEAILLKLFSIGLTDRKARHLVLPLISDLNAPDLAIEEKVRESIRSDVSELSQFGISIAYAWAKRDPKYVDFLRLGLEKSRGPYREQVQKAILELAMSKPKDCSKSLVIQASFSGN